MLVCECKGMRYNDAVNLLENFCVVKFCQSSDVQLFVKCFGKLLFLCEIICFLK